MIVSQSVEGPRLTRDQYHFVIVLHNSDVLANHLPRGFVIQKMIFHTSAGRKRVNLLATTFLNYLVTDVAGRIHLIVVTYVFLIIVVNIALETALYFEIINIKKYKKTK